MVNKSTGKIFQYPLSSLANSIKFKGEKQDQPYFKFVKVRKIFLNGKGLYELKMVHYCFVNSNLPLFNALPYHLMISENEEEAKRKYSNFHNEANSNNGTSQIIACGRKKRKIMVKKEKKNKAYQTNTKMFKKKKARKLYTLLKRINKRVMKNNFDLMKNNLKFNFRAIGGLNQTVEEVKILHIT